MIQKLKQEYNTKKQEYNIIIGMVIMSAIGAITNIVIGLLKW